jgi:hypothetical protein
MKTKCEDITSGETRNFFRRIVIIVTTSKEPLIDFGEPAHIFVWPQVNISTSSHKLILATPCGSLYAATPAVAGNSHFIPNPTEGLCQNNTHSTEPNKQARTWQPTLLKEEPQQQPLLG